MRFWDSSAVLSLLIQEPFSWKTWELFQQDPYLLVWWATPVECVGALARIEREGRIEGQILARSWTRLGQLRERTHEIQPAEEIRLIAQDLLLKHPLRAADALQLASALSWFENRSRGASFITLDKRLRTAALLEGFQILPYVDEVHETPAEWGNDGRDDWPALSSHLRLPGI